MPISDSLLFEVTLSEPVDAQESTEESSKNNAFEIMMSNKRKHLPELANPTDNKKTKLHNDVVVDMQADNTQILNAGSSSEEGHKTLQALTDTTWYLDRCHNLSEEAIKSKGSNITPVPERYNLH